MSPVLVVERGGQQASAGGENLRDLLLGNPASVDVELVGLVDELDRSSPIASRAIVHNERHREAFEECAKIRSLGSARRHSREPALVEGGSFPVFGGDGRSPEVGVEAIEQARQLFVPVRKWLAAYGGQLERHFSQFYLVVVHEDERVQAEIQLLSQRFDLSRLGMIAGDDGNKIIFLEHHLPSPERT